MKNSFLHVYICICILYNKSHCFEFVRLSFYITFFKYILSLCVFLCMHQKKKNETRKNNKRKTLRKKQTLNNFQIKMLNERKKWKYITHNSRRKKFTIYTLHMPSVCVCLCHYVYIIINYFLPTYIHTHRCQIQFVRRQRRRDDMNGTLLGTRAYTYTMFQHKNESSLLH